MNLCIKMLVMYYLLGVLIISGIVGRAANDGGVGSVSIHLLAWCCVWFVQDTIVPCNLSYPRT